MSGKRQFATLKHLAREVSALQRRDHPRCEGVGREAAVTLMHTPT